MASTYLTRAMGSVDEQQFTWSFWVKRSLLGDEQHLVGNFNDTNNRTHIFFNDDDNLRMYSALSGSVVVSYTTNRKFRDTNAWYHIVIAIDTTQAGGNRIRFYVNGEEENSFSAETECNQNTNLDIRSTHYIGRYGGSSNHYFSGSMSHLHFIDGTQYTPSSFGSTDSTTGEWKINTSPSVTYGTEGYFILKDGNSVTDQSPNTNNFTVGGGTLTKTEDNPSNVFATINPLDNFYNGLTITNGNTSWVSGSSYSVTRSTLGASSGKYYFEMKVVNEGNTDYEFGIVGAAGTSTSSWMGSSGSYGYAYESNAELRANGTTVDPWGSTYDDGDILGCAFDLDNNKIYFSKNGSWQQSGDPSAGSNGYTIVAAADTPAGAYFVGAGDFSGGGGQSGQFNFGNGYFGTTAVSSAGTNASGIGIFEYDVPTGFTALSTKGLNL